jgi:hypothetical protein
MRISSLVSTVRTEYSGSAAKGYVAQISRFHRIQASPGFRQAAEWCREELQRAGVQAELLSFPADEATSWWSARSFQEWNCTSATLHLTEPQDETQKLCDYRESKVSLVERSSAFDGELEVVVLEDGEEGKEYEGIEVAGKVVLTGGDVARVCHLAVQERGAVGILSDGMRRIPPVREWGDLANERQYARFWWGPHDTRCFGFVLTPRQGQKLRRLTGEGKRIRVRAHVEARLYDGSLEVVSALIPGQSEAEVLLVGHLCHPQPSANDNASGAGALLEAARTLQVLVETYKLPQPRRSIRLLWVPEMTGTYAYLSSHETDIALIVAGLNLDMVGEDQTVCGCSFLVEFPPQALASFAGPLLARLREEFLGEGRAWGGTGGYALFRHTVASFSGGSDHYILSDPTVGVPTPMLIQWPDRFWHTTADTLDKVDPHMLHIIGSLATTYAYWLASAREPEVAWLGLEMAARFRTLLDREAQLRTEQLLTDRDEEKAVQAALQWPARAQYLLERQQAGLTTLLRLWPEAGSLVEELTKRAESAVEAESTRLRGLVRERTKGLPEAPDAAPIASEDKAASMVVRRCYRGPLSARSYLHTLSQEDREALWRLQQEHGAFIRTPLTLALYWCDGKRTLLEVADLVEQECGQRDMEALVGYFQLLEKMELIEIQ